MVAIYGRLKGEPDLPCPGIVWDFGDGEVSSNQPLMNCEGTQVVFYIRHIYRRCGEYTPSLTLYTVLGKQAFFDSASLVILCPEGP